MLLKREYIVVIRAVCREKDRWNEQRPGRRVIAQPQECSADSNFHPCYRSRGNPWRNQAASAIARIARHRRTQSHSRQAPDSSAKQCIPAMADKRH